MPVSYRNILNNAVGEGLLTPEQVRTVLDDDSGRSPLLLVQDLGYTTEEAIARAMATRYNTPFIDLADIDLNPEAMLRMPIESLVASHMIPIDINDESITVAMVDPSDIVSRDDVRTVTRLVLSVVTSTESSILNAIEKLMADQTGLEAIEKNEILSSLDDEFDRASSDEETAVVKLLNKIISDAVILNAGDIFIEPHEKEMAVRFRVDGVCRSIFTAPKSLYRQLINRLKIQCDLDISEKRRPQDGRFGLTMYGKAIDFRVAILPTIYGELAVLRLLRRDSIMLSLTDLGFLEKNFNLFMNALSLPHGMILVTGPTGSGKSTTLYAAINETADTAKNLITVEDPVEYRLAGLSQVQVHERAGLTFAAALRSILRQDPDQVMIGEIRDAETGKIAIEAALTGHLVLSTLHTNDAPSALARLTEMGIEPYLTASAITLVVAQRLARRLCPACKVVQPLSPEFCDSIGFPYRKDEPMPIIYQSVGCKACDNIGYRGRMGVHEVMPTSESIEKLTVRNAGADDIRTQAIKEGMLTLRQDGFAKVLLGETSIEEILRVVV